VHQVVISAPGGLFSETDDIFSDQEQVDGGRFTITTSSIKPSTTSY
jgi:hypothetical protein